MVIVGNEIAKVKFKDTTTQDILKSQFLNVLQMTIFKLTTAPQTLGN